MSVDAKSASQLTVGQAPLTAKPDGQVKPRRTHRPRFPKEESGSALKDNVSIETKTQMKQTSRRGKFQDNPKVSSDSPVKPDLTAVTIEVPAGSKTNQHQARNKPPRSAKPRATRSDASTTPSTPAFSRDNLCCPICIEKFDEMELRFYPCPCGYRVCAMCIHLIKEKADGKCPSCRVAYSSDRVRVDEEIPKELLNVFRQVSRQEELEAKSAARKAFLASQRKPRSSFRPSLSETLVSSPASTHSPHTVAVLVPPPAVKMTRFTGGLSVWD